MKLKLYTLKQIQASMYPYSMIADNADLLEFEHQGREWWAYFNRMARWLVCKS